MTESGTEIRGQGDKEIVYNNKKMQALPKVTLAFLRRDDTALSVEEVNGADSALI